LQFANNADALLESASKARMEAPETAYHLGQLQFLTGSIYALYQKDDATAVRWFDKALPRLQTACPDRLADDRRLLGEQMVSIGISLWEVGRRNSALSVTLEGTELIAAAVDEGQTDKAALSIPYQNLAAMHRELGNSEEADRLAQKAADADPSDKDETHRR
jgi:tetratricopeptide (TPR) repeat protein